MIEEYRALWRALNLPMGQWWRSTGVWWLVGLGVLFTLPLVLEYGFPVAAGSGAWPAVLNLGRPLLELACLLAALHAAHACIRLAAGMPAPESSLQRSAGSSALFLCALRQAAGPLAILAAADCGLIEWHAVNLAAVFKSDIGCDFSFVLDRVTTSMPWGSALMVIWLVAVMVALRPKYQVVWYWAILPPFTLLAITLAAYAGLNIVTTSLLNLPNLGNSLEALRFGWLVGACLLIWLVHSAVLQRRRVAIALSIICITSSVLNTFCYAVPVAADVDWFLPRSALPNSTNADEVTQDRIKQIIGPGTALLLADALSGAAQFYRQGLARVERRIHPQAPADWIEYDETYLTSGAPVVWSLKVPEWVKYPLLAVNAAYLALVIWFIAFVLLRERTPANTTAGACR